MIKRVLIAIAGGLVVLLMLSSFIIVIFSFGDFFGPAIMWLLVGCVGVLMLFVLYLTFSWVADAVRRHRLDEDRLSEQSLEKILSVENSRRRKAPQASARLGRKKQIQNKKKAQKKAAEEEKAIRKQSEYEARMAAEEAAKRKKREDAGARQVAGAKAKARHIAAAEEEARRRAQEEAASEEEKSLALAEADALSRAAQEAKAVLEQEEAAHKAEKERLDKAAQQQEQEAAARRETAIASARKQAEAIAAARRRAAQTAARTQSITSISPEQMPAFNTQILEKGAQVGAPHSAYAAAEAAGGSIWDKMQVRQSAAPQFGAKNYAKTAEFTLSTDITASADTNVFTIPPSYTAQGEGARQHTAGQPAAPQGDAASPPARGWTYAPARLPNAWKTDSARRTIPGDMSPAHTQGGTAVTDAAACAAARDKRQAVPHRAPAASGAERPSPRGADIPAAAWQAPPPAPQPSAKQAARTAVSADIASAPPPKPAAEAPARPPVSANPYGRPPAEAQDESAPARPRGRPPKYRDPSVTEEMKRPRGRPPKPKDPNAAEEPKRPRGRPPKPKDPNADETQKRPRGRPPKNPA